MTLRTVLFTIAALGMSWLCAPASASPWAEVGDAQLRSDIEILAAAGVIDDITMHWPLPWASIVTDLHRNAGVGQSAMVRAAAQRVLAASQRAMQFDTLRGSVTVDGTNAPSVVRGFDGLGRETAQGQVSLEYVMPTTAVRLSLGAEDRYHTGRISIVPDNSYIAQKIGGTVVYAGYLTHWWGPGWISSLSLSNNARPFPQIGIARDETSAFDTPWLSWLGPWQFEFFVGLLDGPRIARNTGYVGARFELNPLPGLQIGLSRTTELCGTGHRCVPVADYFSTPLQSPGHPDHTNDESGFDLRYDTMAAGWPIEVYLQVMNEDNGPFVQSASSHLFGATTWIPLSDNPLRLTLEYTDSIATRNIFSFGKVFYGVAYNNTDYLDGMRYRGRTLGFSLDGDSRLLTLQGSWQDQDAWTYEVTFHRAQISDSHAPLGSNVVSAGPVTVDIGEARVAIPFKDLKLELAARFQDDQPRPWVGSLGAFEAAITYNF
ncbi:MAG TPA: capsule assembly Wzi family protein [Rhizomicrobium sp.]